ncbi:peptidylprolyl isomerase [Candidatus Woesearchaeota archaeon]|nr:peptidylprolyl isomerase [Candidatus Woesearchaeota archaeon]
MEEKAKKGDFVELSYTARTEDDKQVFDTTDGTIARENQIDDDAAPVTICIGEGHVIKGLDIALDGKEIGKSFTITIPAEEAYGKKNPKLIQLIATSKFLKDKIMPQPGLAVSVDGHMGIIKTVSGGRTLVDFNHPLSGKSLVYDVAINKKVSDDGEKIKAVLKAGLNCKNPKVVIEEDAAAITLEEDIPQKVQELIGADLKKLLPGVRSFTMTRNGKVNEGGKDTPPK